MCANQPHSYTATILEVASTVFSIVGWRPDILPAHQWLRMALRQQGTAIPLIARRKRHLRHGRMKNLVQTIDENLAGVIERSSANRHAALRGQHQHVELEIEAFWSLEKGIAASALNCLIKRELQALRLDRDQCAKLIVAEFAGIERDDEWFERWPCCRHGHFPILDREIAEHVILAHQ